MVAALLLMAVAAPSLDEGYKDLYHLRFTEARACFAEWRRLHPADPMGPVSQAASHLFEEFERHGVLTTRFFLDDDTLLGGIRGQADPRRMNAFRSAITEARRIAEAQLSSNPKDARALLAITMAAGMQADAASVIEKRQLEGLRLTREAERYGRMLVEAAPRRKGRVHGPWRLQLHHRLPALLQARAPAPRRHSG